MADYKFSWLNDGNPIVNPTWKRSGFTGVKYILNVSQDGFYSNIMMTRQSDGKQFNVGLHNPTVRPDLNEDSLDLWIENELIQYEV